MGEVVKLDKKAREARRKAEAARTARMSVYERAFQ